jgi:probable rRNA maturation factor
MSARKRLPPARASFAVRIEDRLWRDEKPALQLLRKAARQALEAAGAPPRDVTILLADDATLKALNSRFRGKRKPTNVLSFPSQEPDYLGDIAIAYGTVAREAEAQGKSFAAHAAHLTVHGVLHLMGYDHESAADALVMEALETQILAGLGLRNPYLPRGKAA